MFPLKERPADTKSAPNRGGIADDISPDENAVGQADDSDLLARAKAWFKTDREHSNDWRADARDDYDMVSGAQWSDDDMETLREQGRPPVVFNRIGPFIDSIEGHEINNRTETRYIPRTQEDAGPNELLTSAAQWVRDECDAEDEETGAVRDLAICGMGWTDTTMDYDDDPDGAIVISRCDPLEMVWDASARKDNLSDAQRVFRVRTRVPLSTARVQFPDASDSALDATWARDFGADTTLDDEPDYDGGNQSDDDQDFVTQVELQWWEYEVAYRMADPVTNKMIRITAEQYDTLMSRIKTLKGSGIEVSKPKCVRDRRKRFYKAVLGGEVLSRVDGPEDGGFTWKCMTGKRDRNRGCWYGIVRGMKDPQRWANKWLSQTMHIINTNAKGGVVIEEGAVENLREFEDTWSSPDSVSVVLTGTLTQNRMQPKPPITFPQGMDKLMEFAIGAIPATAGINPEMLGQTTSMQPGVAAAEQGRKQQAMAILAGMFNAKRRYAKEQGRLMLWMIRTFISDGRLIRIGGQDQAKYVPLIKQPDMARYDVIVDDTPTSPNMKERVWTMLLQLMPLLRTLNLPPEVWVELMRYSPLPETLTGKIGMMVKEAGAQQPQGDPAALAFAEAERAKAQKLQAETAQKLAEAQLAPARLEMEREMMAAKIEHQRASAIAALTKAGVAEDGLRLDAAEAASRALLSAQDQRHSHRIATVETIHDQRIAERGQDFKERTPPG